MKSFINNDGSVSLPAAKLTWQILLQLLRDLNSKQGGWRSSEHWVERGLNVLVPQGEATSFIQQWTENSLAKDVLPAPRKNDFGIRRREVCAKAGKRGNVAVEFGNPFGITKEPKKDEDRLSWWLYMAMRSSHRKITFELPLCATADNLLRADLVNFVAKEGLVEIIELKKTATDGRDSPLMALVESICYGLQLLRCWPVLKEEIERDIQVDSFELRQVRLILAAPDFGKDCSGRGKHLTNAEARQLRSIVSTVTTGVQKSSAAWGNIQFLLSFANVKEKSWEFESVFNECNPPQFPPGSVLKLP